MQSATIPKGSKQVNDVVDANNFSQAPEPSVLRRHLEPLTTSLEKAGYDWSGIREIIGGVKVDKERVSFSEYLAALELLVNAYGDETGHLSTRPLLPGTSAFIFASIRDCKTLGDAMRRIADAYNLAHGGYFNHVEMTDEHLIYSIDDEGFPFVPDQDPDYILLVMEGILQFIHLCFQNMTIASAASIDSYLRKVYSKRALREPGGDFLAGWTVPVRLGSSRYALIYDRRAESIEIEPPNSPPGTSSVYLDLENRPTDNSAVICAQVRNEIIKGNLDQDNVAKSLGMSVATLRRRLQSAQDSFREIKASVLHSKARDQIKRGQNLNAIAEDLGFADLRSFNRAFKSWSGVTPVQYAKQSTKRVGR